MKTIELIITDHALKRLGDADRFPVPPELPSNEHVHLLCFRGSGRADTWMCRVKNGFLVGHVRENKQCLRFIVQTAISTPFFVSRSPKPISANCWASRPARKSTAF